MLFQTIKNIFIDLSYERNVIIFKSSIIAKSNNNTGIFFNIKKRKNILTFLAAQFIFSGIQISIAISVSFFACCLKYEGNIFIRNNLCNSNSLVSGICNFFLKKIALFFTKAAFFMNDISISSLQTTTFNNGTQMLYGVFFKESVIFENNIVFNGNNCLI